MKNIAQSFVLPFFAAVMMPFLAAIHFHNKEPEIGAIFMLAWAVLVGSGQISAELSAMKEKR